MLDPEKKSRNFREKVVQAPPVPLALLRATSDVLISDALKKDSASLVTKVDPLVSKKGTSSLG